MPQQQLTPRALRERRHEVDQLFGAGDSIITPAAMQARMTACGMDLDTQQAREVLAGARSFEDREGLWACPSTSESTPTQAPPVHAARDAQDQAVDALLTRMGRTPTAPAQVPSGSVQPDLGDEVTARLLTARHGVEITPQDVASDRVDQRLKEAGR